MNASSLARYLPLLITVLLCGCATARNPQDPLEPYNRAMYKFNDKVDRAVLKPVAKGYEFVLPQFVRTGITNFFENFDDALVSVNDLLQGKPLASASDLGRIVVNSTIGLAGLIDVSSKIGLQKHNEDFGQTLGVWGVPTGPYFVIPILGPSTIRDGIGLAGTFEADPFNWTLYATTSHYVPWEWRTGGVRIVNVRANLLDTTSMLDNAALDPYAFQRNAYLQYRDNLVHDGKLPKKPDDDDFFDDLPTSPKQPNASGAQPPSPPLPPAQQ